MPFSFMGGLFFFRSKHPLPQLDCKLPWLSVTDEFFANSISLHRIAVLDDLCFHFSSTRRSSMVHFGLFCFVFLLSLFLIFHGR